MEFYWEYTLMPEIRKFPDFQEISLEDQKSLPQMLKDPISNEERLNALPQSLQRFKDLAMVLSKMSQNDMNLNEIHPLFQKLLKNLDALTLKLLQVPIGCLFLQMSTIEEICRLHEFLSVVKKTELEDYTDNCLFMSLMSLNVQSISDIETLSVYYLNMHTLSSSSKSIKCALDIIESNFLKEYNKNIENPLCANTVYSLIQSKKTDGMLDTLPVHKRIQDDEFNIDYLRCTKEKKIYRYPKVNPTITVLPGIYTRRVNNTTKDVAVAIKTNTYSNIALVNRLEGKLLLELRKRRCKNIVKLLGMYESNLQFTLVLEKADMSLKYARRMWFGKKITPYSKPSAERETIALKVLTDISLAMTELSSRMIWHRDIKPDNILVFTKLKEINGIIETVYKFKLADFNISREYLRNEGDITVAEMPGSAPHTIRFAAPEILRTERYRDKFGEFMVNYNFCDIYSLGLTILRIFTNDGKNEWNNNLTGLQQKMDKRIALIFKNGDLKNKELKKLLLAMIRVNFTERITIKQLRDRLIKINSQR